MEMTTEIKAKRGIMKRHLLEERDKRLIRKLARIKARLLTSDPELSPNYYTRASAWNTDSIAKQDYPILDIYLTRAFRNLNLTQFVDLGHNIRPKNLEKYFCFVYDWDRLPYVCVCTKNKVILSFVMRTGARNSSVKVFKNKIHNLIPVILEVFYQKERPILVKMFPNSFPGEDELSKG